MRSLIFIAEDKNGTKLSFKFSGKVEIEHFIVEGGQQIEVQCEEMTNYKAEEK